MDWGELCQETLLDAVEKLAEAAEQPAKWTGGNCARRRWTLWRTEEPEASASSLTATTNQVEAPAPSTCATVPQSSAGSRKPKKTRQQKRRNVKRQLSEQAADQTVHPELHLWQELRQLLSQDVQFPMIAQEPQLVAWAEKHESAIPEGTLGHWTIEHMLTLLARGEDDTPAVKVAIEQILASPKEPTGMVELKVLQANRTSYRTEVRRWVTDQTAQVACLQETHIIPAKDQEIKACWNTLAKQVSAIPAAVTQGEIRQGSQGGLMMVPANHINLRQLTGWESAGKGFQLSVIRLRGIDLCVGNVYMESGVGPTQGVNPELLTRLATAILEAGIPFLIAGDWNCQPGDLSSVMFPSRIGGHVLFPPEPTISTGGTLDYAVCHPKLLPITTCEVLWGTPFRPHAAVQYTLQLAAAHHPVLQAPSFSKEIAATIIPTERPEDPQSCVMLMEPVTTAQVDATWAGFMHWAEVSVCADGSQGRGWNVKCSLAPLLPSHPPLPEWKGAPTAYWMRIQAWMGQYANGTLKERVKKSMLKALRQDKYDFDMEGVRLCDFRAAHHATLTSNARLEEAQSQLVMQVAKTAEKQQLSQEQLQYKQWVETACEGGMKGLCKANKSPETNLLRPYRDKPLEIRPHLRRAEWRDLWIGPQQNGGPLQAALERLKAAAVSQRQTWADVTPKMLRKAVKQLSDKTGGPDGLTVPMLKNLSEPQIEEMARHLNSWELTGEMPQAVTTSLVAMLPKKIDKERPIALTSMAYVQSPLG